MKKWITFTVLLLLIFTVVSGCQPEETAEKPVTSIPVKTTDTTETPPTGTAAGPLTLNIASPREGRETEWGFITITGVVSPASAVVSIDNEGYVKVETDGRFESDYILLDEGRNEFRVTATNGREEIVRTITVVYNLRLHISLSPDYDKNRDWISDYPARIGGRVSDPRAAVTVNDRTAAVDNGGYFSVELQLEEGMNTLTGVARLGDHTATDTRDVAYKREELLSVELTSPWAGTKTRVDYIEVTGTVSDPEADVVIVSELFTGNMSGEPAPVFYAPARVKVSGEYTGYIRLSKGKNQVWVIAHRGNDRSSADVTVEYDPPLINLSSTPNVKIESPTPNSKYLINLIKVTGAVDDADATILVNGMETEVSSGGKFSGYAVLEQTGENTIEVVAFNKSKKSVREIPVTFEPPLVVSLNAETEWGIDYTKEPMSVTGTVNKPGASVTVNGQHVTLNQEGSFKTQVLLKEGSNQIKAIATLGDETDEIYVAFMVENGALMYVPGYSLFFMAQFRYENEVKLKAGQTLRLPLTLETRKDGPGKFTGSFVYVEKEYGQMPLPWPEGLDVFLDPASFTAYPNATYNFELVISASPELEPGIYNLRFYRVFENGWYGSGGFKITIE